MKTAYLRARISVYRLVALLAAIMLSQIAWPLMQVHAATLTGASLSLSDSKVGETAVAYTYDADNVTTSTIRCIELVFATTASGTAVPTDFDSTAVTVNASSDYVASLDSWTVDDSVNGTIEITDATGATPAGASDRTVIINGIENGSIDETTYYLQFNTFNNVDCSTSPVDTSTVTFVYTSGVDVSLSVDPSLSFAVAGTASATGCNGVTSNATTTATTVPLGTVSTATNGIGVQNITVSTNASSGYTTFIRYDNAPTNGASDTIDDWTGTNGSPSSFPAAGSDEAFGYTTNDSALSVTGDGADRFTNPASQFAAFTTSNAEIAYTASTASSEVTCVAIQAAILGSTEAGTYTNTVTYTVTPIY